MAQHDMNIANQGFPATRADINNALQAIATNNSGTSAPSTTFANQWFYNETSNKLFIRNEANNAFIEVATLDQTNNEWQITTGVIQAKDGDGLALKTDDGTTRLFIKDSDGRIGIGPTVTSPLSALHVEDAGNTQITIGTSDSSLAINQVIGKIGFQKNDPSGSGSAQISSSIASKSSTVIGAGSYLSFSTDGGSGEAERLRILAGGGLTFNGDTAAANALNDYEEGTWTPAVANGTLGGTSPSFSGTYTKIGRTVLFTMDVTNGAGDLNIASFVRFSGLPFTVLKTGNGVVVTEDIDVFDRQGFCTAGQGGTSITFSNCGSTSGTAALRASVVCTVS